MQVFVYIGENGDEGEWPEVWTFSTIQAARNFASAAYPPVAEWDGAETLVWSNPDDCSRFTLQAAILDA